MSLRKNEGKVWKSGKPDFNGSSRFEIDVRAGFWIRWELTNENFVFEGVEFDDANELLKAIWLRNKKENE